MSLIQSIKSYANRTHFIFLKRRQIDMMCIIRTPVNLFFNISRRDPKFVTVLNLEQ